MRVHSPHPWGDSATSRQAEAPARGSLRAGVEGRLRRSIRAGALTLLMLSLAVASVACDQQEQDASANGVSSSAVAAFVTAEDGNRSVAVAPAKAETRDAASEAASTDPADTEVASSAQSDPSSSADAAPIVIDQELLADQRPDLSDRSGWRTIETEPVVVAEEGSDLSTVADKLANAQAMAAADRATSATLVASTQPLTSPRTVAPKQTPARRVATPTPKPIVRAKAPTPRPAVATTTNSTFGAKVVSIAMRYLGYRYTWGGYTPSTGFDCTGFTYWVFLQAGRPIPRSNAAQYSTGARISRAGLQPGDRVYFQNTYKAGLSHAGIYIGGGRFIHAQSETTGVVISNIDSTYWRPRLLGGRR